MGFGQAFGEIALEQVEQSFESEIANNTCQNKQIQDKGLIAGMNAKYFCRLEQEQAQCDVEYQIQPEGGMGQANRPLAKQAGGRCIIHRCLDQLCQVFVEK